MAARLAEIALRALLRRLGVPDDVTEIVLDLMDPRDGWVDTDELEQRVIQLVRGRLERRAQHLVSGGEQHV